MSTLTSALLTPARLFRRSPWRLRVLVAAVVTGLLGGGLYLAKGTGLRTMLIGPPSKIFLPRVAFVLNEPADGAVDVPINTPITTRIRRGRELDAKTVTADAVHLVRVADQLPLPADVTLTDAQTLTVTPHQPLRPRTQYALYVTRQIRTAEGRPVFDRLTTFTTAGPADPDVRFTKIALPGSAGNAYSCVTFGPDGALWASSLDGRNFRFPVRPDGTLDQPTVNPALQSAEHGPRLVTGFCFDPTAPASDPRLIVSHSAFGFENVPDLTGKISRLSGVGQAKVTDMIVGLPRSSHDHATNQPVVGPDGAIYFSQPSNSATGAADAYWGNRAEHRLNATVLRLDLAKLPAALPVDVRTPDINGRYDPAAPDAPLSIYASGVRLAYDLCWHSSGRLFAPVNGASAGGNTPPDPAQPGTALTALTTAENDWLLDVRRGGYYGHPNPVAGHFILNGGRPTGGFTFGQVPEYPVGTQPDPKWQPAALVLGQHQSANGLIEYRGDACHGKLDRRLLICRYARGGDILVVTVDAAGKVTDQQFALPGLSDFKQPLDLVQHPTSGDLYVSEFGAKCITLVRPSPAAAAE